MQVDVETNYVRVTIKGKVFQVAVKDEIRIEKSTSQRSMTTGHLLIVMPKLNYKAPIQTDNRKDAITSNSNGTHFPISIDTNLKRRQCPYITTTHSL